MLNRLLELEQNNNNIKVAILGAGKMGKAIFYQCSTSPGINCVGIADIIPEKAIDTVKQFGFEYKEITNSSELDLCIRSGKTAICTDGALLSNNENIDVFIDASTEIKEAVNIN